MTSRQTRTIALASVALSLLAVFAGAAAAQSGGEAWNEFAPPNEGFSVHLPAKPSAKRQEELAQVASPAGRVYYAKGRDGAEYRVWSLNSDRPAARDEQEVSNYLDACAEMLWTIFVEPEIEAAMHRPNQREALRYSMRYLRDAKLSDARPMDASAGTDARAGDAQGFDFAREYSIFLPKGPGRAYLFTDGAQAYVALAFGPPAAEEGVRAFLDSFTVRAPGGDIKMSSFERTTASPPLGTGPGVGGMGLGPGRCGNTGGGERREGAGEPGAQAAPPNCAESAARTFSARDVSKRAAIHARPEPQYTEWARKFAVTGTVRLRGVLNASGEVSNIVAVTRLPHGLTENSIRAMHLIRFDPAEKDGCKVSQYITVEYNYNIY